VRRGQLSLVYVLDEGHARMRAVTPGAAAGDAVEILAGLAAGEVVVMAPPPALTDGAPIKAAGGTP
jgi:multidrug efflux pump subunit AcrA (membrane-fusion protein)